MPRSSPPPRPALPPFAVAPTWERALRASIIITNHDYGRFVADAIDSALAQSGAEVEVIVVDDGSTDESMTVIDRYRDRVRVVSQQNLGQKAAFNAGFEHATGDLVLFLDADDELEPGIVAAAVAAVEAQPQTARVLFRLAIVDEHGRPNGAELPAQGATLPEGDVRWPVLSFPDDLAWPPTSGNVFSASVLRRVLPLPVDDDRTGADHDLHTLVPLLGSVVALPTIGGRYRLHATNAHARTGLDLARTRLTLRRTQRSHAALKQLAADLGYPDVQPQSVTTAAHRLVSLRLSPSEHPMRDDTRWQAMRAGLAASRGRFDVTASRRAMYAAWFIAAATVPRPAVKRLAEAVFQSTSRPRRGRRSSPGRRP